MLKIQTKLAISLIPNAVLGLFSSQFIPKDTILEFKFII